MEIIEGQLLRFEHGLKVAWASAAQYSYGVLRMRDYNRSQLGCQYCRTALYKQELGVQCLLNNKFRVPLLQAILYSHAMQGSYKTISCFKTSSVKMYETSIIQSSLQF